MLVKRQMTESFVQFLLNQHEYRLLDKYLSQRDNLTSSQLNHYLQLAIAILATDTSTVNDLLAEIEDKENLSIPRHNQALHYYMYGMKIKFQREEYGDYFRALTPALVDILRLIIERHMIPNLSNFIEPTYKETDSGELIYKGQVWSKEKIESSRNKVRQTWNRYYGDRFNYKHYISSSHLVKLIADYSHDDQLVDTVNQIRQVEKNLRNILAHEVIYASQRWIESRVNVSLQEVQIMLKRLLKYAGLEDVSQRRLLEQLNQRILNEYKQLLDTKEQFNEEISDSWK